MDFNVYYPKDAVLQFLNSYAWDNLQWNYMHGTALIVASNLHVVSKPLLYLIGFATEKFSF